MSEPRLSDNDIYARKDDAAHYEGIGDETEHDKAWLTGFTSGAEDTRDFYENLLRPIPCSERMPPDDTPVLIWSTYCGPIWHNAHHMGEDKDPEEGQPHWNWTIDAAPLSYEEVGATFWLPMPPNP